MAQINIVLSVPDTLTGDFTPAEIIKAFCAATGYQPTIKDAQGADIPNPVTRQQHLKDKLWAHIRETVEAWRADKLSNDARVAELARNKTSLDLVT